MLQRKERYGYLSQLVSFFLVLIFESTILFNYVSLDYEQNKYDHYGICFFHKIHEISVRKHKSIIAKLN